MLHESESISLAIFPPSNHVEVEGCGREQVEHCNGPGRTIFASTESSGGTNP